MDRWDGMDFTVYAALIAKSWYLVDYPFKITCTAYRKYGFMISIYFLLIQVKNGRKKKQCTQSVKIGSTNVPLTGVN